MKQQTKQRIVGAVVLIALALIFLPLIFDGEGRYQPDITSRIPKPPLVAVLPDPVPNRPVVTRAENLAANANVNTSSSSSTGGAAVITQSDASANTAVPVVESIPDVELDRNGLPAAWSVRLGTFSKAANAAQLIKELKEQGYRAYTRIIPTSEGDLTGVFVGPWVDRAKVEAQQQALLTEFQLAGIVVKFEVERL